MAIDKEFLIEKQTKTEKPSFDYFNATNFSKLQAKTQTTQNELSRFKTDYDSKRLNNVYEKYQMFEDKENKLTEDEENQEEEFLEELEHNSKLTIQKNADFQKLIKEQNSFEELEDTLTYKKIERNPKVKLSLNKKTKLMVFTYTFVSVMLLFLLVYNVFAISNLNTNISSLQGDIVTVERAIKDIGNMTESYKDEARILDVANDLSFNEVPVQNVVTVNLYEKQNRIEYQGQTNWFDTICKFLNNLFGG